MGISQSVVSYKFPNWLKCVILGALMLGIFFRFYALGDRVYSNDETFSSLQIFGHNLAEIIEGQVVTVDDLQRYQTLNPNETLGEAVRRIISKPYVYPPLYPILMQVWFRVLFNYIDQPEVIQRSLSAAISLAALVGVYWLCFELTGSKVTAWIAIALIAISPFHIQYSQIVRTYSLTTVSILISSAALLQAMRVKSLWGWIGYAVTVSLGLYSNLLFGFVAIAHGVYVLLIEKFRFNKTFKTYLIFSVAGIASFLPWFYLFISQPGLLGYSVQQVLEDASLKALLTTWLRNTRPIFFDFYDPWVQFTQPFQSIQQLLLGFVVLLTTLSIYFVCFKSSRTVRIFILSLIGFGGLILMIKDVISGGTFSTRLRYMIPYVLGIQIAVACFLANQLQSNIKIRQRLAELTCLVLIAGGVLSAGVISHAESWWTFGSPDYPLVAREINKNERPVVIFEDWGDALTMSYLLDSNVHTHLTRQANFYFTNQSHTMYDGFSEIFLFKPSKELLQSLDNHPEYKTELAIDAPTQLPRAPQIWRVEKL